MTAGRLVGAPLARGPALEGGVAALGAEHVQALPGPLQALLAGRIPDAPVGVDAQPVAHVAAQQRVDGHAIVLARDVPERLVDARERRHQHVAAAEKGGAVDVLPVVLDAQRVLADQVLGELLHGSPGALGLALQRGLAPADDAVVGGDLDQAHAKAREELLDSRYFHGGSFERR